MQGPTATLGIYVDAGSVYEKPMQSGGSDYLVCQLVLSTELDIWCNGEFQGLLTYWNTWPSRPP